MQWENLNGHIPARTFRTSRLRSAGELSMSGCPKFAIWDDHFYGGNPIWSDFLGEPDSAWKMSFKL